MEVTVTDLDNSKQYVRFYVREGERGSYISPPDAPVSCNVGYIWFNDRIASATTAQITTPLTAN